MWRTSKQTYKKKGVYEYKINDNYYQIFCPIENVMVDSPPPTPPLPLWEIEKC